MDPRTYTATESLHDGSATEIRALRPDDREGMRKAVERMSEESVMLRFFAPRREFSDKEVSSFIDIDFERHVALVATLTVDGRPLIVGGSRYIVTEPGVGEIAFAIDDAWQHHGLGSLLLKHLVIIARDRGLKQFVADVLPENTAMLGMLRKSGLDVSTTYDYGVMRVTAPLTVPSSQPSLAEHHD
jgi:GNAT superfamily N-acetyltransferase